MGCLDVTKKVDEPWWGWLLTTKLYIVLDWLSTGYKIGSKRRLVISTEPASSFTHLVLQRSEVNLSITVTSIHSIQSSRIDYATRKS